LAVRQPPRLVRQRADRRHCPKFFSKTPAPQRGFWFRRFRIRAGADLFDDHRILDARDDPRRPAAGRTGLDVEQEGCRPMIRVICLAFSLIALPSHYAMGQRGSAEGVYALSQGFFDLPLRIADNSGMDRVDWPVTSGIPLPVGAVNDPSQLALLDESGNQIPAQFTVLSRYSRRDNSLRWVLMDFQVSVKANSVRRLWLTNLSIERAASSSDGGESGLLVVERDNGTVTVDTGPLQATVSGQNGRIFDRLVVHGEQFVDPNNTGGSFVVSRATDRFKRYSGSSWNTHGWESEKQTVERRIREQEYFSGFGNAELAVEQQGPLRTTLRIRGTHLPAKPSQDSVTEGFYNFTLRLHFFAGKSFVKVQLDIENSGRRQPLWNYAFSEAGFFQEIPWTENSKITTAFLDSKTAQYRFVAQDLEPGNTLVLHQKRPKRALKGKNAAPLSQARLLSVDAEGKVKTLTEGNVARFLSVSDQTKGLMLGARYFWQEGPRAIEVDKDGIRLIPLADERRHAPEEPEQVYDLDFGQRYISDLLLYFHRPSTHSSELLSVIEAFEYPLAAVAPTSWYADTEAWYFEVAESQAASKGELSDHRHWTTPDPDSDFRRNRTNYNSGGHHQSLNSSWLAYLLSGSLTDFQRLEVQSRWHIARNPGWAYRDNVIVPGSRGDVLRQVDRQLIDWDRLTGFGPKDFFLWLDSSRGASDSGGRTYLNAYKQLPDMEHYANFILFEYYYLTGDRRALDAIHGFVNWALNFQHHHLFERDLLPLSEHELFAEEPEAMRRGHYSRVYSWMLYTTLAGFHATGSPVMEHFAIWQIRRALALLRHRHGQFTSWEVNPGWLLAPLDPDLQRKIAEHFDFPLVRERESIHESTAKSWMEAQNALALHEAYKTFGDERILDALWGMGDYFAHHVLFYPELGAFTALTGMPTPRLTEAGKVSPVLHDRHIQVLPVLFHYTGWRDLGERYRRVKEVISDRYINSWFTQTLGWEAGVRQKSSSQAPEAITDLKVTSVSNDKFTLSWTSPKDDGALGRASRYFVKISTKPIVEFAPTDHPRRDAGKTRIIAEVERQLLARPNTKTGQLYHSIQGVSLTPEVPISPRAHPDWHDADAFWMAEHVDGEPTPQAPGSQETFVVRHLNLHNWFGSPEKATLAAMDSDRLFVAICSWDEDRNLSALSNVVEVHLH
jgi:hypothetical protein